MARINAVTGTGLIVLLLSVAAWIFLPLWPSNATTYPLIRTLQTSQGVHFNEAFMVPHPARYYLDLVCKAQGPLQIKGDLDAAKPFEKIHCDMHVTVSDEHGTVVERRVRFSSAGSLWNGQVRYNLLRSEEDVTPGIYTLAVDNRQDLQFLNPTEPRLELFLRPGDLEEQLWFRFFLTLYCLAGGIVGLALVGLGLVLAERTNKRAQDIKDARSSDEQLQ